MAVLIPTGIHNGRADTPDWAVEYGREFWKPARGGDLRSSADNVTATGLGEAIDRVRHAFEAEAATCDPAWKVIASSYEASIGPQGLKFVPALAANPSGVHVHTLALELGGESSPVLRSTCGPWHVKGNTAQRRLDASGSVVEHLEATSRGVEISWIVHRGPSVPGGLAIEWHVSGSDQLHRDEEGWRVGHPGLGKGVRIGQATVIDSSGRSLVLETDSSSHGLRIEVPASFLAEAAFPIAVDPLISAEFDLDQPVTSAAPSAQFAPAIASDGTNHLVVWHDNRNGPKLDLYAARLTTNGTVLDPSGFAITTATNDQWQPSVAFNGTNFLVVWQDARSGNQDVYAARVSPSGAVFETNGLAVVTAANDQRLPAVASRNGEFLVAWQDGRSGAANQDIYAARIRESGLLVETNGFIVSNAANSQSAPAVAVVGTNYVVAWHDFRSGTSLDAVAARVTSAGNVLDPLGITLSASPNDQWNLGVAGGGGTGLIVWQDGRNGTDEDIFGTRFTEQGTVLDPGGIAISQQPGNQRFPVANGSDGEFRVVWQDHRDAGDLQLYANMVDAATGSVSGGGELVISSAPNEQRFPAIARAGDQLMIVWEDIRSGTSTDIYGARIDGSGAVLDPSGIVVSTLANRQETPAIASNGSIHLAVWRDFRNDALGNIHGARFSADGTPLDSSGLAISTAGNYQIAPRVAAAGEGFFVVWQDYRNGSHDDIYGARVMADGSLPDPNGIAISTALGAQRQPAVAGGTNGFLVVWQDRRNGTSDDIYGARVGADGLVQDAGGLEISRVLGDQKAPGVAGLSGSYFVVWEDNRSGASNRVFGTSINASGVSSTPGGFELSGIAGEQLAPRIAASTNQFLAVWQMQAGGQPFNIHGTRISAAGAVQDTNAITISGAAGDQVRPAAAAKGGDFMVVWEDQRVTGRTNLYASRVAANGAVLETAGESAAPAHGSITGPALSHAGADYLLVYQTRDAGNAPRVRGVRIFPSASPTISLSPGAARFVAGGPPVPIDVNAVLVDGSTAEFGGGTLTVDLTSNATANDRLSVRHEGNGPGQIGYSGNEISHGGVLIGFSTGGTGGSSPLLIIFNGAATASAVEALARNITFGNVSANPFTQARTARFTLNLPGGSGAPTSRGIDVIDAGAVPSIVTQPLGATSASGSSVTLSVVASGTQPFSYQWRLNGAAISGATNASYTIGDLQAVRAGAYTVVVSNLHGSVSSDAAIVTLFEVEMYAGLTLAGPVGSVYRVEFQSALDSGNNWQLLTNITLSSPHQLFFDAGSSRRNQRYYRAIRQE